MSTKTDKYVALSHMGEIEIHLPDTTQNYATLCGMDGDDPHLSVQQAEAPIPRGAKVTCQLCYAIWKVAQRYSRSEFSDALTGQ